MTGLALGGLAVVSSIAAGVWGGRRLGLRPARLGRAGLAAVETIGTGLIFLGLNLGLGVGFVLAVRLGGRFVSFYPLLDPAIVVLSVLQGLIFRCWREGR